MNRMQKPIASHVEAAAVDGVDLAGDVPGSGSAGNSTTRATSPGSPSWPAGILAITLSMAACGTAEVMSVVT
jgi:hypothetical protein